MRIPTRVLLPLTLLLVPFAIEAQAQVLPPATYFGSASIDGQPPPDGTEVRAFIDGKDCTQLGPNYRGTVLDGGVARYAINAVHESQIEGCGLPGKTVTFSIGGRPAAQAISWTAGPTRLDLNAGSGQPIPLPTTTPTSTAGPTQVAATATGSAGATPQPSQAALPTAAVTVPSTATPGAATDDGGEAGTPVLLLVLVAVGVLAVVGGSAGLVLSRRGPGGDR